MNETLREQFVDSLLEIFEDGFQLRDVYDVLVKSLEYVADFDGWTHADRKEEVLKILAAVLDRTDSPGPDAIVDWIIEEGAEVAIDYLWDAAAGRFSF